MVGLCDRPDQHLVDEIEFPEYEAKTEAERKVLSEILDQTYAEAEKVLADRVYSLLTSSES